MYVSVNTVVCNYLLCMLELPLRKHVFCYLARGSKAYAINKYLSIYLSTNEGIYNHDMWYSIATLLRNLTIVIMISVY